MNTTFSKTDLSPVSSSVDTVTPEPKSLDQSSGKKVESPSVVVSTNTDNISVGSIESSIPPVDSVRVSKVKMSISRDYDDFDDQIGGLTNLPDPDDDVLHTDVKLTGLAGKVLPSVNIKMKVPEKMKQLQEKAQSLLESAGKEIKSFRTSLTKMLLEVCQGLLGKMETLQMVEKFIGFLTGVLAFIRSSDGVTRACIATSLFTLLGVGTKLLNSFLHSALTLTVGKIHGQGKKEGETHRPEGLVTLVSSVIANLVGSDTDKEAMLSEKRMKRLSIMGSAIKTLHDLISYVCKIFKYCFESVYESFHGYPWSLRHDQDFITSVNEIITAAASFRMIDAKVKLSSVTLWVEINNLLASIAILDKDKRLSKSSVFASYSIARRELLNDYSLMSAAHGAAGSRKQPVWIHLNGKPKQGKSQLTKYLIQTLARAALGEKFDEYNAKQLSYEWNDTQEYWEGYTNQLILTRDDLMQLDDIKLRSRTATECINLANVLPKQLTMAGVEKKGTTYFTSQFMITSANDVAWRTFQIANPGAYRRRIDFYVDVSLLDPNATTINEKNWSLQLHDNSEYDKKNDLPTKPITLPDLCKQVLELYQIRAHFNDDVELRAASFAKEFYKMYQLSSPDLSQQVLSDTVSLKGKPHPTDPNNNAQPKGQMLKVFKDMKHELNKFVHENMSYDKCNELAGKYFVNNPKPDLVKNIITETDTTSDFLKTREDFASRGYPIIDEIDLTSIQVLPVFLTLGALVGFLGCAVSLFRFASTHNIETAPSPQTAYDTERVINVPRPTRTTNPQNIPINPSVLKPVAQSDRSSLQLVPLLQKNSVSIRVNMDNGGSYSQRALFLYGRVFVCAKHMVPMFETPHFTKLRILTIDGREFFFDRTDFSIIESQTRDFCFVNIDKYGKMSQFPDITHHFPTSQDDILNALTSSVYMLRCVEEGTPVCMSADRCHMIPQLEYVVDGEEGEEHMFTTNVIQLLGPAVQTFDGECGSPYVSRNNRVMNKLLGIHIAGAPGSAYCQIILQQEIEQAKSLWPLNNQPHAQGKGFKLPDGLVAEKLPHKKIPRMQTKSQFVPSLIQGMGSQSLPVSRKPAHLVPFHPPQEPTKLISPAELAIKKAVRPDVKMSPENKAIYKECVQVAFNEINGPSSVPPRPLPLEEALNTPIGYTHLSPVYMSTSPGWPHNTVPHFESGKGDFMTMNNDGWRIPKPLLQDIIVKKVRNILDDTTWYPGKKEFVPVIVVNDCLKDELRPIDKVDAGKTRIFSGISVEDLVLMRMFFGDLVENAARNHNEPTSSCSLGINPEGPEWRMLYDKLIRTKQHKKRVLAGDIKTQDGSTTSDQSGCYNEVVLDYYDKNEKYDVLDLGIGSLTREQIKRIRTRLLYEVFGGRAHVFMGWLYWPGHGNPSGNFLTTHSNCVHTRASMLFAAHRYTIDILKNPISIVLLAAMIIAATYGDDHVATVDEGPLHNFGMGAMCHYFALIGYELTDFKKDAIEYDPVTLIAKENQFYNINEVEFLKRRFYHIQGISTAPLPKALILDMPNWCTTKHTLKVGTQCSGEAAILAAFHWGPDFYEDVKQIVNSYFIEFGIPQFRVDYLELYSRYYNMKKFGKFDPNLVNYGYQSSNHFDADFLSNDILITKEILAPKILDDPEAPLFKFPSYVYKKPYDEWPKDETEDKNIPRAQMLKTPPPPHEKPTGGYPEHDMHPTVNVRLFPTMIVMTVTAPVGQHPNQTECDFWINAALGLLAQDVSGPSTEDLVMTCDYTFSPVMGAWALFQITQGDAMHVQNLSPFPVALFRMVVSSFQNMMPRAQMKKEQAEKSEKGIISGVTEGASIIASSISSLPIVGNIASKAAPILKMVSSVASSFGLDYPNSTKATEPLLVRQTSSLAAVKGLDVVESIACDPANQVSNDYSWFCENVGPTALFSNYKLRPGLVTVNNFDGTYVQNQVIAVWPVNPMYCAQPVANTWAITPLANLASFFRYWTGSMKFDCEFTTSRYVSARIRFEWHPDPSTITTLTNDDSGDIVSLTVDVNGDTSAKFTVPYLKDVPWLIVPTPDVLYDADRTIPVQVSNGFLVLRVINPPVVNNSDADSNIDFAMFIAGGEDMTFARPTESWSNFAYVTNQAGLLPKAQMKKATLAGEFSQTFKPLAPSKFRCANNILMGEKIDSFPELFHRYTDALELTGTGLNFDWNVNPWLPSELTNFGQWNRYLNTFLFKRGNIRSKVLITDNNPDIRWTVSNCVKDPLITVEDTTFQPRCRAGTIWNVNTFRRTSEVEVPFYGIYPFVSTMYLGERFEWPAINIAAVGSTTSTTYSASVLLASADNFSCGQVCAPGYFLLPGMVDGNNNNSKETLRGSKVYSQIRAQMLKQEGHGQEDRKVVETTEQDSIQLSSFRDQVGVRSADHPLTTQIHADTDPYQDQGLTQVLSRPYLTHTFSWTGSSTYGALVQKLNFPNDLFLISNIAEKLNRFKYLRSAVHLEVRLNSTLFHSGKLLVVWAPHWNSTSNSQSLMIDDDMFLLSSLESLLISANSNETVAFDIPYVAPSQYFDLALDSSIGGPYEGFFGTVKFFVLAPLRLTGATATPSITVSIWTSFVNPEVAGLSPKNITPMKVQIQGTQVVNRLQKQKIPSLYIKQ